MTPRFELLGALAPGLTLIEASAGTGKTYAITTLFLRLVIEEGLSVDRILVVTFTEAATAELVERIRSRFREFLAALEVPPSDGVLRALVARVPDPEIARRRAEAAIAGFDEAAISTIHGFCQRILRDCAFESGLPFDLTLIPNPAEIVDEVVGDFWVIETHDASDVLLDHLEVRRITPDTLTELAAAAVAAPDMAILPPDDIDDPGSATLGVWKTAFEAARDVWTTQRDAIVELLLRSKALNRNLYRVKTVAGWIDTIDDWFGDHPPGVGLPDWLSKLTPGVIAAKPKKGHPPPEHPFFEACEAWLAADTPATAHFDAVIVALQRRCVVYARREVDRRMRVARHQSFDDLLQLLDRALAAQGGDALGRIIAERYPAALIDEFQDTDPVQYRIFRAIFGPGGPGARLYLIGDPKQAIYAFRGADVFAYLAAARDTPGARRFTLSTNYRSDPGLVGAVNFVFGRHADPFALPGIEFDAVRTPQTRHDGFFVDGAPSAALRFAWFDAETLGLESSGKRPSATAAREALPTMVARDIAAALDGDVAVGLPSGPGHSGPARSALRPGHIAVLVRTNAQAHAVQRALMARSVPAVLQGTASVYAAEEAADMTALLAAVAHPHNTRAVRNALATPLIGHRADKLAWLNGAEEGERAWEAIATRFRRWHQTWLDRGFIQMFRAVLADERAADTVLTVAGGERRMTNYMHLAERLHAAASTGRLGMAGLLRWLDEQRAGAGDDAETSQLRLERDDEAVQVITVHRSKGLEYPVVYCPYLWESAVRRGAKQAPPKCHDDDGRRTVLDLGSADRDEHEARAEHETRAEAMRLLYVALTRARHHCTVAWGPIAGCEDAALARLLFDAAGSDRSAQPDFAAVSAVVGTMTHEDMRAALDELVSEAAGFIEVRPFATDETRAAPSDPSAGPPLAARRPPPRHGLPWRVASFTDLKSRGAVHRRRRAPTVETFDAHDHDAGARHFSPHAVITIDSKPVPLADFPRGAHAGTCLHAVFENIAFDADSAELEARVAVDLAEHALADEASPRDVAAALADVLTTPLIDGPDAFALRDIPPEARLAELEFLFPIAPGSSPRGVSAASLADVFRRHGPHLPGAFADAVEALELPAFAGYLRGFIDLVFERDGRWYVADYKSNHLGPTATDYGHAPLEASMIEGLYHLQAHLYCVAVHRLLRWRLPGYDYDAHFGGYLYLYLRGMASERGPATGVYGDRPPRALIEALSRQLDPDGEPAS